MKKIIGLSIAGVILIAGIALGIYSYTNVDTSWYAELDDTSVSEGVAIYYGVRGYDAAYLLWEDTDKGFWDSKIEDVSSSQWIHNYTQQQLERYLTIEALFEENGLELDDDDLTDIEDTVYEDFWYYGRRAIYGPMGVDEDAYTEIITVEKKAEKLIDHYADRLSATFTEDDLRALLEEDYASFIFISMYYYDDDGNSAEADYDALCDRVEAGESVLDLAREIAATDTQLITTSIDEDAGRDDVAIDQSSTSFPIAFRQELFQAELGDVLYYDDSGNLNYSIAQRTDILADDYYFDLYRDDLTDAFMQDAFEDLLLELMGDYDISINTRNISQMDVKEILAKA